MWVSRAVAHREFAFYHTLAARGYLERFVGHLRLATAGIVDRGQMTYHIMLLTDGYIVVGKTVQKLATLALVIALLDEYSLFELVRVDNVLPGEVQSLSQFGVQVSHMAAAQILFVIIDSKSHIRGLWLVTKEVGKSACQDAL